MLLAQGQGAKGLETMVTALQVGGSDVKSLQQAIMDVAMAIRAVDGHVLRANRYVLYQKHGAAGPDGRTGTDDDLTDPLADMLP